MLAAGFAELLTDPRYDLPGMLRLQTAPAAQGVACGRGVVIFVKVGVGLGDPEGDPSGGRRIGFQQGLEGGPVGSQAVVDR